VNTGQLRLTSLAATALLAMTPIAALAEEDNNNVDPLEPINRKIYAFNDTVDRYFFRPVGKGYNFVLPQPIRNGVGNFFDHWTYPVTIVNGFLQGKFRQGTEDTVRFVFNTTFGLLGFFDPATKGGLTKHTEDFGLTFARWGIPQGPYVVIPVLGPFTARSGIGILGNIQVNPVMQIDNSSVRTKLVIAWFIESRAALIGPDETVQDAYDPYMFLRDAYLQNRDYLLNGSTEDDAFFEEDFEDF
jgi:phospholipid-binding lipoprotein MlaA